MTGLRVGMIGLSAEGGWALAGHVPAIAATAGMTLFAVGSRTQGNADAAARATGAERAYGDPQQVIDDPEVDVVAVVSPVPTHRRWILAALERGKHVITEWPVAVDPVEVHELAAAAERAGVRTAVDLQARMSTAARRAAELIDDGRIGRVLGATVLSTTAAFGPEVPEGAASLELAETGMNLRTIQTAHTLDLATRLLGPIASLQALGTVQYPSVEVIDTGRTITRALPDRILVQGTFAGGATFSAEVVGGRPADRSPFRLEVTGTQGDLVLHGGGPRGFQAARIALEVDGDAVALPGDGEQLDASAANVAQVYAALRDDIDDVPDTAPAPGFAHAARLADLIETLGAAVEHGDRVDPR